MVGNQHIESPGPQIVRYRVKVFIGHPISGHIDQIQSVPHMQGAGTDIYFLRPGYEAKVQTITGTHVPWVHQKGNEWNIKPKIYEHDTSAFSVHPTCAVCLVQQPLHISEQTFSII
jgi:hypothetical protein